MRKQSILLVFSLCLLFVAKAQQTISLHNGKAPGSESWTWSEKEMFSPIFNTQVVYNVVQPTLTVFRPADGKGNGVSVIVAPGGGFVTLSINSEGNDVAKWLVEKGVTVFVLKYRLAHSLTDDPVKELMGKMSDPKKMQEATGPVIPLAIQDGIEAVKYVRSHASEFGINPKKIGFMGFSAGGSVTMGVTMNYTPESRPDFSAPIYAFMPDDLMAKPVSADAPPLFVVAASDDQLGLAPHSANLYNKWLKAGKSAEIHMYVKGGHGFGMKKQQLPSDKWIERFYEWLEVAGWLKK